jgi:hypothetical protein
MGITLNFDILETLYDCRESDLLDGRIQVLSELLKEGHTVSLYKKMPNWQRETFITLNNQQDLDLLIESNFRGWKPTEHYKYI